MEALLIDSVAALMKSGVARLERVAQDGVRVRASAGAASFRRASTLKRCRREAAEPVASLKAELEADPGAADRRHQAARRRAAREREQRVSQALEAAEALAKGRAEPAGGETKTDERVGDDAGGGDAGGDATKTAKAPRVSTTDPEARVMKMADGGFRPAYNVQFASDVESGVIAAVVVDATGSDMGRLAPMSDKLERDYGVRPGEHLADGGFARLDDLIALAKAGVTSYVPVARPRQAGRDRHLPLPKDPPALAAWRQRMGREEAQAIYRERAAAAELPNAQARNRGLLRFPVRGGEKHRALACAGSQHDLHLASATRLTPIRHRHQPRHRRKHTTASRKPRRQSVVRPALTQRSRRESSPPRKQTSPEKSRKPTKTIHSQPLRPPWPRGACC